MYMDIKELVDFDSVLPTSKARLLMGEAGLGKSSIVKQLAERDKANLIIIRLSEYEPQDLVGLPYLEEIQVREQGQRSSILRSEKVTKFARPYWWPTNEDRKTYLFLDELDRCREDMHPAAMQLALSRTAGGRKLHDNVVVWAACNGEEYLTIPLDQALVNRFALVHLRPTVDEWIGWARKNRVHRSLIDFIKQHHGMLDTPENLIGKPNVVCPSRRSWSDFGEVLLNIDNPKEEKIRSYGATLVGYEASSAFARWTKDKYDFISPDDIFEGKLKAEDYNVLSVACAADDVAEYFMTKESKQQYDCLRFFKDAGAEAFANLFEALPREASSVIRGFDDINEYVTAMRKQVIRKNQNEV